MFVQNSVLRTQVPSPPKQNKTIAAIPAVVVEEE